MDWIRLLVPRKTGLLAPGRKNAGNGRRFSMGIASLSLLWAYPSAYSPTHALPDNASESDLHGN